MFIRKSKTVQYRHGNETLISKGSAAACPVNIHQKVLDLLEDVEEKHFFIFKPIFRSKGICKLIHKNKKIVILLQEIIYYLSLAHLSRRIKRAFLITRCPLSVRLSTFHIFNFS